MNIIFQIDVRWLLTFVVITVNYVHTYSYIQEKWIQTSFVTLKSIYSHQIHNKHIYYAYHYRNNAIKYCET